MPTVIVEYNMSMLGYVSISSTDDMKMPVLCAVWRVNSPHGMYSGAVLNASYTSPGISLPHHHHHHHRHHFLE